MIFYLQIAILVFSIFLVVLVLLHRGKGGGLSTLFGGGIQSSLAGSSVVEKNLNILTVFIALLWLICIIGVGITIRIQ